MKILGLIHRASSFQPWSLSLWKSQTKTESLTQNFVYLARNFYSFLVWFSDIDRTAKARCFFFLSIILSIFNLSCSSCGSSTCPGMAFCIILSVSAGINSCISLNQAYKRKMTDGSVDLSSIVRLKKRGDLWFSKKRTVIIKNADGKSKNKTKKIESKVINSFLICSFILFCSYKPQKVVPYYQNVTPAGHFTLRPNKFNPAYPYNSLRCKTENKAEIVTNPPRFVKLAGLIGLTKLLHIIHSS